MKMNDIKLKPYQFCGEPAEIVKDKPYIDFDGRFYRVYGVYHTENCPLFSADLNFYKTKKEAAKAWNRRAEIDGDLQIKVKV